MAVTTSPKFGFPMATSGGDPAPNRAAWMDIFDALEDRALALGFGTLANRPSTPPKPLAWFDTAGARLSVHTGTGGSWTDVSAPLGAAPAALAYGTAGAEGVSNRSARADHTHTLPAIKRSDLPAITSADLPTVPVNKGGTGLTTLTAGYYLRGDGTNAVQPRSTAQVLSDIGAAPAAAGIPSGGSVGDVLKRTSSGYAWGSGTVSSTDITDATATGRSVLTAANAAAVRTAIGAGTSSFDGSYSALTGKPTIPTTAAQVGAVAITDGVTVVTHGSNAAVARPAGAAIVIWIGTVQPTNLQTNDFVIGA